MNMKENKTAIKIEAKKSSNVQGSSLDSEISAWGVFFKKVILLLQLRSGNGRDCASTRKCS
jgi:hypothetical protein